jgi:hypothetical protein
MDGVPVDELKPGKGQCMTKWLLMVYRVPREPSASRVYVWRKLKQLGAVALQDAAWLLPAAPRTQEQFQWLAAEIVELGGEATIFASEVLFASDTDWLAEEFNKPVRGAYQEILVAMKRKDRDLAALSRKFQQVQAQDYFQLELGAEVRAILLDARGVNES